MQRFSLVSNLGTIVVMFKCDVTSSRIDLYADDTTLTSSTNYSSIGKLEGTLWGTEIVDWVASNKLPINEGKTKAMLITGKRLPSKINEEMTLTIKGLNSNSFPVLS